MAVLPIMMELFLRLINNLFLRVFNLGINLHWIWFTSVDRFKNWWNRKNLYANEITLFKTTNTPKDCKIIPRSVNYHFTRQCNYSCGFCFHTAKTSYVLPLDVAKKGMKMLKDAGIICFIFFNR